ncbi:DltE, Short-chain dehydrogenase [Pyrenophora tritici-repentis]|nr:Short-chain dehydrogenase [Pyrenophora tritici-repentis]KAI1514389.1 Short-chain dehydrogenase [Pyrenophora tritici-repentis]KAI1682793.1 Short-chain dehydrogenase [Pyrenophora tritici-repentis]PZD23635.1 DltE, Short-chain dehydrogenase [Pyrenophora tritici-repentis]
MHYYKCDLTNFDELQSIAARIRKDVGEPTITIANAGICRGKPILAASKEDIDLTFGVNNLALLWTAKTFIPSMVNKNHGHFLIVASQTGYTCSPGLTDYSATKSAAIAIYEGLHGEIRRIHKADSVRVSCVSPGPVDTKMFNGIKLGPGIASLNPETLGKKIADIVCGGRAKNIFIPAWAGLTVWMRAMPDWVRVGMQGFSTGIFSQLKPHNPMEGK